MHGYGVWAADDGDLCTDLSNNDVCDELSADGTPLNALCELGTDCSDCSTETRPCGACSAAAGLEPSEATGGMASYVPPRGALRARQGSDLGRIW